MVTQLRGMLEPTELYTLKEGILWYVNYLHVDFFITNATKMCNPSGSLLLNVFDIS